jgi:hypothetical protein
MPNQVEIDFAVMVLAHATLMAGRRPVNGPDKPHRLTNGTPCHANPA